MLTAQEVHTIERIVNEAHSAVDESDGDDAQKQWEMEMVLERFADFGSVDTFWAYTSYCSDRHNAVSDDYGWSLDNVPQATLCRYAERAELIGLALHLEELEPDGDGDALAGTIYDTVRAGTAITPDPTVVADWVSRAEKVEQQALLRSKKRP